MGPGVALSDTGQVMDGYTHRLYVNVEAKSAYVVQEGGIAGTQTVFGPLPVASCSTHPLPRDPFKPDLLPNSASFKR